MKRQSQEYLLHYAVANFLGVALPDEVLFTHIPLGEHRTPQTAGRLKRMGVTPGWPDFVILTGKGPIFIELKVPGGSLNKNQKDWHARAKALGYIPSVCRSVEDVETLLKAHGLELKARAV